MDTATRDDLDRFLAAERRVLQIVDDSSPADLDPLLRSAGVDPGISVRAPDADGDLEEWNDLVEQLAPDLVLVPRLAGLVESVGFDQISSLRPLVATARYQWVAIGGHLGLVITHLDRLDAGELAKAGSLCRGLLNGRT